MARCPHCNYESTVISAFCPACGGALHARETAPQQDASVQSEEAAPYGIPVSRPVFHQNTLGMGWLRFLALFVLPLNIINGIISLMDIPDAIGQFRSPEISAFLTNPEKILFYASIVLSLVQVPLLCFALWGLFKQQWKGVQALLINYVINALYAIVMVAVLLTLPGVSLQSPASPFYTLVTTMAGSAIGAIAMFFINRVYFQKRRGFFLPEKQ